MRTKCSDTVISDLAHRHSVNGSKLGLGEVSRVHFVHLLLGLCRLCCAVGASPYSEFQAPHGLALSLKKHKVQKTHVKQIKDA